MNKTEISSMWGCRDTKQYEKYLKLLPMIGLSKKSIIGDKSQIVATPSNLEGRLLLQGGREVLIKTVALAIPMFAMSYFKISKNFCTELEHLIANF